MLLRFITVFLNRWDTFPEIMHRFLKTINTKNTPHWPVQTYDFT